MQAEHHTGIHTNYCTWDSNSYYHLAVILIFRDVDKKIVTLPHIRETGKYVAELKLHPEVSARVRSTVFGN